MALLLSVSMAATENRRRCRSSMAASSAAEVESMDPRRAAAPKSRSIFPPESMPMEGLRLKKSSMLKFMDAMDPRRSMTPVASLCRGGAGRVEGCWVPPMVTRREGYPAASAG